MTPLRRGMVVDIDFDPVQGSEIAKLRPAIVVTNDVYNQRVPVIQVVPVTAWNERKGQIVSNVTLEASAASGLDKKSVADCLQTRPVDRRHRLRRVRGCVEPAVLERIDDALRVVFGL